MSRTALITGCSSGIGAAAARAFAGAGFQVWATMRDPASAAGVELAQVSGVTVDRLDVTDRASVEASVSAMLKQLGRIDVVVNNAGAGLLGPFETASAETVEWQFALNVLGPMTVIRAALPTLRAQHAGVIINVTSIGGLATMPLNAVYHGAKFAVDGFSEALRYELDPFGVCVKVVAPGGVATAFGGAAVAGLQKMALGDYAETVGKVMAAFQSRGGSYSTAEAIAAVILTAATDGTDQLRYVAGDDAKALVALRQEKPDVAFVNEQAARFGLA